VPFVDVTDERIVTPRLSRVSRDANSRLSRMAAKAYANQLGSRIKPKEHAEPVTVEAREQQGTPKRARRKR
jgi:hypothetical protein